MIVLAYLFTQLPSMASSLSGGIGLSISNVAGAAMSRAGQAAGVAAWTGFKATGSGVGWLGKSAYNAMRGGNSVSDARSDNAVMRGAQLAAISGNGSGGPQREQPAQALTGSAAALQRIKNETEGNKGNE
jgi:hypothetical protein